MARNDGVHRASARNANLTESKIGNAQRHNEREKESYTNPDIVPERAGMNVHYKTPSAGYSELFKQMEADKLISTRGLKDDANHYGELIFDVNSAYFHNHGGYDFAKQFYADAYRAAVQIVGGEQYILSAVMHADERNRAMSEALGKDIYHYHLHVVYLPVVEKQIKWSARCKDPALRGTVRETVMQVSSSKKWQSHPALDELGEPVLQKNGKPVLRKSYSVLQDDFFNFMRAAGYDDIERGERGSSEEHLTVTQFKVEQEQARLAELQSAKVEAMAEVAQLQNKKADAEKDAAKAKSELNELAPKLKSVEKLAADFSANPEELLPQPDVLETAKSYREKKVKPVMAKIVKVLRSIHRAYLDVRQKLDRMQKKYDYEVATLTNRVAFLSTENKALRSVSDDYDRLCRAYGQERIAATVGEIKRQEQTAQEQKRAAKRHDDRAAR